MKQHVILISLVALLAAKGYSQCNFSSVTLVQGGQGTAITFAVSSEANVFNYRVEASNDGYEFEIAGVIRPTGNSVLEKTYRFPLYDAVWKYYRIDRIAMNGTQTFSNIIEAGAHVLPKVPELRQIVTEPNRAIVHGR